MTIASLGPMGFSCPYGTQAQTRDHGPGWCLVAEPAGLTKFLVVRLARNGPGGGEVISVYTSKGCKACLTKDRVKGEPCSSCAIFVDELTSQQVGVDPSITFE